MVARTEPTAATRATHPQQGEEGNVDAGQLTGVSEDDALTGANLDQDLGSRRPLTAIIDVART